MGSSKQIATNVINSDSVVLVIIGIVATTHDFVGNSKSFWELNINGITIFIWHYIHVSSVTTTYE